MQDEKVSVIIPIYNVEKYLERCIDSVLSQSYVNIDVLLINDGSTDNSESICRKYENRDSRVRYYYHHNIGLARTRNRGISLAEGQFITFLDSDDWVEPTFIEALLKDIKANDADIGLCDINYVDEITGASHIVRLRFQQNKTLVSKNNSAINKSRLFAWGKIYRKSLFTRFNIEFPDFVYEDICIPLLIIYADSISYTSKPLIHYVTNRYDSLSNASENISDIGKGLIWLKERLTKENLYERYAVEFKKIALAQLRFAARRFGKRNNEATQTNLRELTAIVGKLLPELRGIADKKYYVPEDAPILRLVLDRCLPYENQIVSSKNEANDCLRIDDTMLIYDLAELIMEIM